ncbi:protein FAM110B [Acanthopagrus latus]|uniref:protein FAM110B n=1 Tax=Acanthopagrus latus TaxID=8177 RepID=UPI00187BF5D5|nr:protein FAM110B [Acanthopagrus latus]XP_036960877.1 protein FAM110B [Acanthopagrus latus]XP_036960878.1 protein FAM110B [Acanthopagrus latus]XP_036960879.1 protein FAM110B [Acanthopagrus latus]XP_036960880.1 protein FAM110B [Acanthopagrus latus]XP_036960881.1 protein FAM110B [Acanthopagrus latus]XP_036960882.1 protein FAM110B [Acanthopagrus latus]XP_036960883.1 protein FAM110B [Acanthopagrus latus]XP_036960884.1 protein FAM110B [Acanthopagrus latus]XP_036960885.1 protein FAM110B [Acanth
MPVETLRPSDGRLAGVPFTSAMPFRILHKGPDYFRRQAEPGARKLSAVERLEADKAKYVKSQHVALTRQAPIKPPVIRKPLVPPGKMLQCQISIPPARKVPRCPADVENGGGKEGPGRRRGPALNLDILNNLINDVCDGPMPCSQSSSSTSPSSSSPSSGAKSIGSSLSAEQERSNRLLSNLKPLNHSIINSSSTSSCTSSPLNNNNLRTPEAEPTHRPPPIPARAPRIGVPVPYSSPNSVTVRRVDVRPQAEIRKPQRAQLQPQLRPRQTAQGQVAHPQVPPPPPPTQNQPHPQPNNSSQTLPPPPAYPPPSPMLARAGMIPPASPAFTRISNASSKGSSRKHPSLHRSKSDLSDRFSRATADMERFFNYCGLDPKEVEGMGGVECFTRANSDIVSVSKLRSVSTPSSEAERAREDGGDEDNEDGPGAANERVPYGISVIERNARVIKWLYGIRQARDANSAVSNV